MITKNILQFRLKKLREQNNITQEELAKVVGVSQTTINAWEKGRQEPSLERSYFLIKYFNVNFDYLYGNDFETQQYISYIKNEKYITDNKSPFTEEDRKFLIDLTAEKINYEKDYKQTKETKYITYLFFVENSIDSVLLKYKEIKNNIININFKKSIKEVNTFQTLNSNYILENNKIEAQEQQELIRIIQNLTPQNCKRVKDFITGILIAEEEKQNTIQNILKKGE